MTRLTRSILAASVLAAGLGFAALPKGGEGAEAAGAKDQTRYSARLEEAFRDAQTAAVDEALLGTLTAAARKADRLAAPADCAGQAWPYVAAGCLAGVEVRAAQAVRTVTVEYRVGDSTSVLVRLPAQQVAGR
jgi:hypothetical protein